MWIALFIFRLFSFYPILLRAEASRESCCRDRGVSEICAQALCNPDNPPDLMKRYNIFDQRDDCRRYLNDVSICITNGRDSSECCENTAIRKSQGSCFGLCKASGTVEAWRPYQSCVAINIDSMYKCIHDSYTNTPTPPTRFRISSKSQTSVSLRWDTPASNGDLANLYKVHLFETSGPQHVEVIHDIKNTHMTVDNLKANAKYSVYVVAHAREISRKSMPSEFVHFSTFSTPDSGIVYKDEVKVPLDASTATLACHLRQGVASRKNMVWEKKEGGSTFRIYGPRYSITTYANDRNGLMHYVSALQFRSLNTSDFGLYKCHLEGEINDYGEVRLTAESFAGAKQPESPPESPVECCSRSITRPHCQSVCSGNPDKKKEIKPAAFLPHLLCMDEFNVLMTCTLQELNNAACCITKRVPYHCLGMCDPRYMTGLPIHTSCLNHVNKVYACQTEKMENLPYAVSNLRASIDGNFVSLEWSKSIDAEIYHIYHRLEKGPWVAVQTTRNNAIVTKDTDEVVIIAANKYGGSGATRIILEEDEWVDNYV